MFFHTSLRVFTSCERLLHFLPHNHYSGASFCSSQFTTVLVSSMSSSSDQKSSKKRAGRKRQPPLAPGPAFQFVVANHPEDFRANATMRNVRSHVMYQHRGEGGLSPPDKGKRREGSITKPGTTRKLSLPRTTSDGILENNSFSTSSSSQLLGSGPGEDYYNHTPLFLEQGSLRALAARIIEATTSAPARSSAPPTFGDASELPYIEGHSGAAESLENLTRDYVHSTEFFCHGKNGCPILP
jgi:hypothetical protein